MATFYTINYL